MHATSMTSEPPIMLPPAEELALLTNETITQEQIDAIKHAGLPKPDQITWEVWNAPRKISGRHEYIIMMSASGMTPKQICREVDMTELRIRSLVKIPKFARMIRQKRDELFGSDAKAHIKALVSKAVGVVEDTLDDKDEKGTVRLDAAKYVIDHTVGKATQTVEVGGNLLVDLVSRLDKESRDVSPANKSLATTKDSLDNFVDGIITEGVVVGKRGDSEVKT